MDDKEIREKAAEVLLAGTENVPGFTQEPLWRPREAVTALSLANLLMTADALEAMEACAKFASGWMASNMKPGSTNADALYDIGRRILAKREQEKGPRYVVEIMGGAHVVRDTQTTLGVIACSLTETTARAVAETLNKHAGEKEAGK